MMMLGTVIMTIGHIVVAAIIGKYGDIFDLYPSAGYAGAAFVYIYMIGYGITAINCNVISSEMFPSQHRSQAMGMIFGVNWLCNFAVAFATPAMLSKIKFGTFIVFAASCVGCFCWAKFVIPETAGKTVEEMDLLFKDQLASTQAARIAEINRRVGLTDYHAGLDRSTSEKHLPSEKGLQLEHAEEVA
jgi:dipeptide/tripeptide permease